MADEQTETWVVQGVTPAAVRKALGPFAALVPLDKHRGRRVRLWPGTHGAEPQALSSALGDARLVTLARTRDTLEVAVWSGGERLLLEQTPRVMRTSTQLGRTHASLQRAAGQLDFDGRLPVLLRDEDCSPGFLALLALTEEELSAAPP